MRNKIIALFLIVITVFSCFSVSAFAANVAFDTESEAKAYAAEEYLYRNVLEDLADFGIDCEAITKEYSSLTNPLLLRFFEYGYDGADNSGYRLVVYIFAPYDFYTITSGNIQLAIGADSEDYSNFEMNRRSNEVVNGCRFSKWVVELDDTITVPVNELERTYKVSGFELTEKNPFVDIDYKRTEYPVGKTYKYTGFLNGYGVSEDTESTLTCLDDGLEIINLETNFTYYRISSSDVNVQQQVNTVYFSIPKKYEEYNGALNAITHSYTEYWLKPTVVTDDEGLYQYLLSFINNSSIPYIDSREPGDPFYFLCADYAMNGNNFNLPDTELYNIVYPKLVNGSDGILNSSYGETYYLKYDPESKEIDFDYSGHLETIPMVFYVENLESLDEGDVAVTSEEILEFINKYPVRLVDLESLESYDHYNLVEEVLHRGKETISNLNEFDYKTLLTYDSSTTWYEKFADYGLFWWLYESEDENIIDMQPIVSLTAEHLELEDEEFSKTFYVNIDDVFKIKKAASDAIANNETFVLFRFDVSEYEAYDDLHGTKVSFEEGWLHDSWYGDELQDYGFMCQQSYYDDYDIISLHFGSDPQTFTTVPVVASPKDFIADITVPDDPMELPENEDWWQKIMMFLGLIVILLLWLVLKGPIKFVFSLIMGVVKAVINLVLLPFRLLLRLLR